MKLELSYIDLKDRIRNGLNRIAEDFVEIGYNLKQIRDRKLYIEDGYDNINDFAREEYGLSQSNTSRFIAINEYYSIEGNSPKLLPEFEGYGSSKLSEMLSLSPEEMKLVSIRTTVAEIRTIKYAKREAQQGEYSDNYATSHNAETLENTQSEVTFEDQENEIFPGSIKVIIDFFRDKARRNSLKELGKLLRDGTEKGSISEAIVETINPSGHLMFRKGVHILMFEDEIIKYSRFGTGGVKEFTYMDFLHDIALAFDMAAEDPWVVFYGEPEPESKQETKQETKPESKLQKAAGVNKKKEVEAKKEKDSKTTDSITEESTEDEQLPGQAIIDDYPETHPNEAENQEEIELVEADVIMTENQLQAGDMEETIVWHNIEEKPEGNQYVLLAIMHNGLPNVIMGHYNSGSFREDTYNGKGCTYKYWAYKPKSPLLF